MRHSRLGLVVCLFIIFTLPLWAQKESFSNYATAQLRSDKLGTPEHLRTYVVEGKLRLSLRDAVTIALENNTEVRIRQTTVQSSRFSLLGAHGPFDPVVSSVDNITSTTYPPYSFLQDPGSSNANYKSTTKNLQFNYSQLFETGTTLEGGFTSSVNSSNSSFYLFNPYTFSTLTFQAAQSLLRNAWFTANRAPLIIARRNLEQSRAAFVAEVSNAILQAVNQYWAVVQATETLNVVRASMEAAEATYKRDKRALELGALPPLDIYRSESQVASRRVQVIQSEYALKQAEEALRLIIGANQDPYFQALDLELTETPDPGNQLRTIDAGTALQSAFGKRPEFEAARAALAKDESQIRLARNHLLPQLDLMLSYASNGVGGNSGINDAGLPVSSSWINQMFRFGYPAYTAQLTLNLPVKNRTAQAEMGSALVSRRGDLYSERLVKEQVTLDVRNAVHQLEQAKLSIAASKEALDLAQKTMAAEQRKYQLGSGTIFFVLEAQTELATAQQTLLQSEVGYQMAIAAVDHATGELLEPYHVQIAELTQ
jgi:outer membrane protein